MKRIEQVEKGPMVVSESLEKLSEFIEHIG
jgi:hypothetical protein